MMELLQRIFWFLVTIGILIPIHEYGHYRVAVACNVKVLRFSIGIGRVIWRRKFGKDGTEFALSMLPLGGYVSMVSEDDPNLVIDPADLPRAFNRQPLWQRSAIVAAGPIANFLLAIALYAFVQWYGVDLPAPVASTPLAGSLMAEAGLRSGDRVVATAEGASPDDGAWRETRSFDDVYDAVSEAMVDREPLTLRVMRAGESAPRQLRVAVDTLDPDHAASGGYAKLGLGQPFQPPRVAEVVPGGAAAAAGLAVGDVIERIDGHPITDFQSARELILASRDGAAARPMQWEVRRGDRLLPLVLTARIDHETKEGVPRVGMAMVPPEHGPVSVAPLDAVVLGAQQTWRQATGSLRMFGLMITGRASLKNLSGPGTIAEVATSAAHRGLATFLSFLALVSLSLGVLNLLPIPILDGGTLLYYLFEGATGRPVSELWQTRLRYGGVLAILLLMSIALSNDVVRHLGQQ
jgi:regulator of sigma E protease